DLWALETTNGFIRGRTIINCAGLFGDVLEQQLLGASSFSIHPRKGQFVVFDKAAARYLGNIILPVPNERTKGIVLTRTVYGNLLVGPTA
ncbi:FAD-dependent oxidoreductase, partial [Acinetobacter baumannii]|nr:FAD-dependent oxidoreductase [Acinetobacter baumannii]